MCLHCVIDCPSVLLRKAAFRCMFSRGHPLVTWVANSRVFTSSGMLCSACRRLACAQRGLATAGVCMFQLRLYICIMLVCVMQCSVRWCTCR